MNKTIFLCSSMTFYKELVEVEKQLVSRGFTVFIPVSARIMKQNDDFEVSHYKGVQTPEQKGRYIQENFAKISQCEAILVINNEKNGVKGYIGANVLMEIGLAFYLKKKIYIWNPVEETAPYKEELLAFHVEYVYQDVNKIK